MFGGLPFGAGYFGQGPGQALTFYGPVSEHGEGSAGEPSEGQGAGEMVVSGGQGSAEFVVGAGGASVTYVSGSGARE